MHGREEDKRRRLFHTQARSRAINSQGEKQQQRRDHTPHRVGMFQPENRSSNPARRLSPPENQSSRRQQHLLGDDDGVSDPRLQDHRRRPGGTRW